MLLTDTRNREEVSMLEFLTSFLLAVLGGVACHYIIKWLDGDDKGNSQPSGCFATIKEKKNPSTVLQYGRGICFFANVDFLHLFAYRHYSICRNLFQYTFFIPATPKQYNIHFPINKCINHIQVLQKSIVLVKSLNKSIININYSKVSFRYSCITDISTGTRKLSAGIPVCTKKEQKEKRRGNHALYRQNLATTI